MPIIDKYCVRITIISEQRDTVNQGSGVIIKKGEMYYVLTARHCITYRDDQDATIAALEHIVIEKKTTYNGPFEQLVVTNIIHTDRENDLAFLQINKPILAQAMTASSLGKNLRSGEKGVVFFRGYQGINNDHPRTFEATIIDTSPNEFIISLRNDTFTQGGELGADLAKGLSGSGVFLQRNDKVYLVGHLKSVIGQLALNNDIKCSSANCLERIAVLPINDLELPANLPWDEDKRVLNDVLIRRVFESLREYNRSIADLGIKADEQQRYWQNVEFKNNVQKVVAENYIGILGSQIMKLNAISTGDKKDPTCQKNYIDRAITTAKRAIQLLCFLFLARLLDQHEVDVQPLSDDGKEKVKSFFDNLLEPGLTDYFAILKILIHTYLVTPTLEPPLEELDSLAEQCLLHSNLEKALNELNQISDKSNSDTYTLSDCFEAELQLTVILERVAFLSRYRMASIKNAHYHQNRKKPGNYQHSYFELDRYLDLGKQHGREVMTYSPQPFSTEAVVFYRDDYSRGVNLAPFIIDFNTVHAQTGHKIYFYSRRAFGFGNLLTYSFVEDNSPEEISYENTPDSAPGILPILKDVEKYMQLRKDNIHRLFMEARDIVYNKYQIH